MPWNERDLKTMREEFVKRVLNKEKNMAALCREYGISRPTGYKWLERHAQGLPLEDASRRPLRTPNRVDKAVEDMIVAKRKELPAIGAVKIRRILENDGEKNLPSTKTVNNIFKRHSLITKEASQAVTPIQCFEKTYPNEMWQADYKGHFAMGNSQRCHPLNIIDDHSRFNLACEPQKTETFQEIKPVMIRLFETYGMPFSFLCDNGNPWGTPQSTGFSAFEVWMMELGILVLHGRPRHPQTQGKEERFNQSMTCELLKQTTIEDWGDATKKFAEYRRFYNEIRPHHALDLEVPAKIYTPSSQQYTGVIKPWEYPEGHQICKVTSRGHFNYGGQRYYFSEGFRGKEIAVRPSSVEGCISLFFRQFRIGRIDVERRVFTLKRAYLIDGDPRHQKKDG